MDTHFENNADIVEDVGPDMSVYFWGDGPAPVPERVLALEEASSDGPHSPPPDLQLPQSPYPLPGAFPGPVAFSPPPQLSPQLSPPLSPPTTTYVPTPSPTTSPKPKTGIWSALRSRYNESKARPLSTDRSLKTTTQPPQAISFSSPLPPPVFNPPPARFCDGCSSALAGRPCVHCLTCPDYDLCSRCYHEGRITQSHQQWHQLHTIHPPERRPRSSRGSSRGGFACSACAGDLTGEVRVKCIDCYEEYNLCLDCNLMGAATARHTTSHRVSYINDVAPARLMARDGEPSDALIGMVEGLFEYMDSAFKPKKTGRLEPEKLSAFYRKMGVADAENIGLFTDEKIAFQYLSMRCQYMLISAKHEEISSRAKPWTIDALDTTPTTPVLTKLGWMRFFVVCTWRAPTTMHFLLQNAINTGYIRRNSGAEPYYMPFKISRSALPSRPLNLGEAVIKN